MKNLEEKDVEKIYNECLLKNKELTASGPTVLFTPVKSLSIWNGGILFFSTERLNIYKQKIIEMVDSLRGIDCGEDLYNLRYDKNNNCWCTNLFAVHKLVDLAMACGLVNYAIIAKRKSNTMVIIRNKKKDDLTIQGTEPVPYSYIPTGCVKNDCLIDEKTLMNINRQEVNREIPSIIDTMNVGLSFLGIYARISNSNQIDFYDENKRRFHSQKQNHSNNFSDFLRNSKSRYFFHFKDKHGNIIDYEYNADENRHVFNYKRKNEFAYVGSITRNSEGYDSIIVDVIGYDEDKTIKNFEINGSKLMFELSNRYMRRKLCFNASLNSNEDFLSIMETSNNPLDSHILRVNANEIILDAKKATFSSPKKSELFFLASNIVFHPRNKEFIQYIIDELDKDLPGLKNFVSNFPLYQIIIDGECQSDDLTENYVEAVRNTACDIKKESEKTKKMTYFD